MKILTEIPHKITSYKKQKELSREWKKVSDDQKEEYQQIVDQKKEEFKEAMVEYQNSKIYKKYIEDLKIWIGKMNYPETAKERKTRSKGGKSKELKTKMKKKGNLKKKRVSSKKEAENDDKSKGLWL